MTTFHTWLELGATIVTLYLLFHEGASLRRRQGPFASLLLFRSLASLRFLIANSRSARVVGCPS